MQQHLHSKAFALGHEVPKSAPMKKDKMWLALGLFLGMIAVQVGLFMLWHWPIIGMIAVQVGLFMLWHWACYWA